MITNNDAIFKLSSQYHPNIGIYISGKSEMDLSGVTLEDGSTPAFTFGDVLTTKAELEAAEPMRLLRLERNRLLAQTDWWVLPDRTPTQAQIEYRQALRDITTQTPALDSDGNLMGITWPVPPND